MDDRTGHGRHHSTGWAHQDGYSQDTHRNVLEARGEVVRPQGGHLRVVASPER